MKRIITCYIGILIACSSCNDFLEPKSNTNFVPEEISSLEEMLIGEVYYPSYINTIGFTAVLDDDVDGGAFVPDRKTGVQGVLAAFTWQPDMFETFDIALSSWAQYTELWARGYSRVLGCNAVLDYVDKVNGTQQAKDIVRGQALTMRGFAYLHLVNVFGIPYSHDKKGLGVPLKLNSAMETIFMERNTVEQCYAAIEKDLLDAERVFLTLPAEKQWRPNYKASLPMAQLLLSRMYLYMEKWDKAHEYAEKVIKGYSFALKDLNDIVRTKQTPYYDFCNLNCPEQIFLYAHFGDYTSFTSNMLTEGDQWSFVASQGLMSCYTETDLRHENYMIDEPGCTKTAPEGMPWDTIVRRPAGKYGVNENRDLIESGEMVQSIRLSEAYLNSMEAAAFLYKAGNGTMLTNSVGRLEDLRMKRIRKDSYRKLGSFASADALISYIRDERRRELCFEGHRWFDLRRYGMPEIKHRWYIDEDNQEEYTLNEKDPAYVIPIPKLSMTKNPNLVQNPLAGKRVGVAVKK